MKPFLLSLIFAALACGQTRTVTLQWNHVSDAVTFNMYRAGGACASTSLTWGKINTSAISAKTYTDAGVPYGIYCYRATAVAGTLESAPSNTAQADAVPHAPTGLVPTVVSAVITVSEKGELTARLDVKATPIAPAQ